MLLDRRVGVLTAVVTSVIAALHNPAAMALWATLILALTLLGMATLMVGLVVVVPWLAHASWHAYRDLVHADADRHGRALMFGFSEEQIAQFGLTFGVGAFMLYMVFIIFQLARESKAGPLRHLRALPGPGLRPGRLRRQGHHQVLLARRLTLLKPARHGGLLVTLTGAPSRRGLGQPNGHPKG